MKKYKTALVIGAGAFGTSIASILSNQFEKVILKVRSQDIFDCIQKGENSIYLPGFKLSSNITATLDWNDILDEKDDIELLVSGLPTSALARFVEENESTLIHLLNIGCPFISLSKGIETSSLKMPDDIFFESFAHYQDQFCFLSGPSFAKEILEEQITLVSLAGKSRKSLENASQMLETDFFKIFPTYDIKGVLIGGALKNILAIAAGIAEGLGFNHNTRAAIITQGIREMLRFGVVFNARPETFYGLSGMGDLILTTTGGLSRNKQFGLELAKGRKPQEVIESERRVVEGYKTTLAAFKLAEKYGIRAFIFKGMYQILYEGTPVEAVLSEVKKMSGRFYDVE